MFLPLIAKPIVVACFFYLSSLQSSFAQLSNLSAPWPSYSVTVSDKTDEGYYFFGTLKLNGQASKNLPCHMILNAQGELVYFKNFENSEWAGDFKLNENGNFSYCNDKKKQAYILNHKLSIIDSVAPKNNLDWDFHDFKILKNGNYLFLASKRLKKYIGKNLLYENQADYFADTATVMCWYVQELNAAKEIVYEWNSSDAYEVNNVDKQYLRDVTKIDLVHLNAVWPVDDSTLLVSARNYNELTKVNKRTGKVSWRLGGKANQFEFINDKNPFVGQHAVRLTKEGTLLVFDNGIKNNPTHPATAKEYALDEKNFRATLLWQYAEPNKCYAERYGSVQKTEAGNYVVGFGNTQQSDVMFQTVSADGKVLFDIRFADTLKTYRCFYAEQMPAQFEQPVITQRYQGTKIRLSAPAGYTRYYWSTGETTQYIVVDKPGNYQVFVANEPSGYIGSKVLKVEQGL